MAGRNDIVISSAGRRVALVEIAKRAGKGRVLATDMDIGASAASHIADIALQVPPAGTPEFLPELHRILIESDVGLVIPTLDTELLPLSGVREAWGEDGIVVSVSDESLVTACRNKHRTAELFESLSIPTPESISDETTFPRFVKPVGGSRSEDTHAVWGPEGLRTGWLNRDDYIHQELIDRDVYDEFTVDIYYRRDGTAACMVPRLRLEVRSGEVSKARTVNGPLLRYLWEHLAALSGARGCITAQFFVARHWESAHQPVLGIEINPRFGGGYPLTDAAGGTYVKWLVDEYLEGGYIDRFDNWTDDLLMLRYDASVFVQ